MCDSPRRGDSPLLINFHLQGDQPVLIFRRPFHMADAGRRERLRSADQVPCCHGKRRDIPTLSPRDATQRENPAHTMHSSPTRDEKFYDACGDVVLQVESTLFRVRALF